MSEKLKEFIEFVLNSAEEKELTVEDVHFLPLALQLELEKNRWVTSPYKRKMP
ncbi:MAG: hypothetical protein J1E01_01350 [Acetatifactor sp.]|nr:hypothetical protein [Acetatifactor sp.]